MEEIKILIDYEEAMANGSLPEMPEALDEKCQELIEKAFVHLPYRSGSKHISTSITRTAAVVLLLFCLSTVMVLSVDAFRVPVLNFLLDKSGKFAAVSTEYSIFQNQDSSDLLFSRFNEFIPSGYTLTSCVSTADKYSAIYQNADTNTIRLTCATEESVLNVDMENTSFVSVGFGEYTAAFSEKTGYRLIWLDSQSKVVYTLFSDGMTEDEFWKFAYFLIS